MTTTMTTPMATTDQVAAYCVDLARYAARNQGRIDYTQTASRWDGIANSRDYPELPHHADCSSFTTWLFWAARRKVRGSAGTDIVNGQRWRAGYTGTQVNHGARHRSITSTANYKPGRTLVFYANAGSRPTHVALYIGNGLVVSHGGDSGPVITRWNYRRVVQARAYAI